MPPHAPLEVIVIGAGPIGEGVARAVAARRGLTLVAVVDVDPNKLGRDVAGVAVRRDIPPLTEERRVAVLTTTSSLAAIEPLVHECLARGMPVVSTCEELCWPWEASEIARRIDEAARKAGVGVLGTGVNPGFAMDALPLALSAPCAHVRAVRVERIQDASTRRRPFQDKVGVGLAPDAVRAALDARRAGHVGLQESARMVAATLGLVIDAFTEEMRVIVADSAVERAGRRVEAGQVLGVEQRGRATRGDTVVVDLLFRATFGEPLAHDRVVLEGEPRIDMKIEGGLPGDVATCSIVANAIPVVALARPGLLTMADVPLIVAPGVA
jgi:2,4-diaminopentanoate dehydrogenase